ncbi:MAG: phosphopantetheine-binding protein [Eubacteriales bacterium]|nr:phosphopantetheine-binding protein [Clostridiales bacterium]
MELEKIKEIMADSVNFDVETITEETRFDSMGLDSLDIVDLLMRVDEAFGTQTEPSSSLVTVGDLIAHIKEQTNA